MFHKTLSTLAVILSLALPLSAQEPDPLELLTFSPELVMQHQNVIGLQAGQATSIKEELRQAQGQFTDLEWDLQAKMESFLSLLERDRVDEEAALLLLDEILELESRIKRIHLTLAIRIKNQLSTEQQEQLQQLR